MAQQRSRRVVAIFAVLGLFGSACDDGGSSSPTSSTSVSTGGGGGGPLAAEAPRTFGVRLSEGTALGAPQAALAVVDGAATDSGRIDQILARLPEWAGGEAEQTPFNWPTQSVPPPRTGTTIDEPFPGPGGTPPADVPTGPLQVVRYQPEGDVPVAPYVAITFNQPMVAVGTVAQVAAQDVPVTISPAIEGTWQWVGTKTLRFDYGGTEVDRLPMATTYTVTVPAGTVSASGGELAEAVEFTFTTPAPTVQTLSPVHDTMALDQLWVAVFDQRVDPAAVLGTIHVTADGRTVALRLATAEEVDADDTVRNITEQAAAGRWVAFRPTAPMPADADVRIDVGPGTPSAEGPATTTEAQTFSGRTYAPLRVTDVSCSSGSPCRPGSGFSVQFNNELDADATDAAAVAVAPALPGHRATVQWASISIDGVSAPRTEYTITLPAGITDVYGQTLGEAVTRTVQVGPAEPSIQAYDPITTLDPFAEGQQLTTLTVNHDQLRVRVFAVGIDDFADYARYANERDWVDPPVDVPDWEVLSDATVQPEGDADVPVLTSIDLAGALGGKPGHVVVLIEPVPAVSPNSNLYWLNRPALTWVQSTSLGVDLFTDATDGVVWTTDLRTGAPVQGVDVHFTNGSSAAHAATDADGVARLALPAETSYEGDDLLVATKGDDSAILPTWAGRSSVQDSARWFVFDDRQVYRPGETMKVKGWVRRLTLTDDATLHAPGDGASVHYVVTDAYGVELLAGDAEVGALGGFDLSLDLPETANLGPASLTVELRGEPGVAGQSTGHSFQVQDYRRPEFEVTTHPESEGPHLSTSPATVAAEANYYAGGPLPDAPVTWVVTTSDGTYSPAGWDGFTFGVQQPWWWFWGVEDTRGGYPGDVDFGPCCGPVDQADVETYQGTTDSNGAHYLQIGFEGDDGVLPDLPVVVTAEATVEDVNRQAWASSTGLLVHAADRYVGLRSAHSFVRQGEALVVDVIVTDIDGNAVPGTALTVSAGRVEGVYANGEWTDQVVDAVECDVTSAAEPVPCEFTATLGGQYRITAVVADAAGGRNRTELTTWVSGAAERPSMRVEQEAVTVVPDRADYAPGDTAELLVSAPFATGEGLMTISRNGLQTTERFTIVDGTAIVQVPITEADTPSLQVGFDVVGSTPRTAADGTVLTDLPARPAYAVGGLTLPVSLASRTLTVDVTPQADTVLPGADTALDVVVTDASGAPVQGVELAVVVVDEAVLALSDYEMADPLGAFYGGWYEPTGGYYSRSLLRLLDPEAWGSRSATGDDDEATPATTAASAEDSAGGDGGALPSAVPDKDLAEGEWANSSGSSTDPITVRSQFDALALFEPSVTTDAQGRVTVPVTLPDTLTRYRVMVVAVSGDDSFGKGESTVTAQLPLSVRPSPPRFANFGDTFELPVVVQNLGTSAVEVDVVLQTSNLSPAEPAGRTVSVPAGDRVEVRFPVATDQAGTAAYRVAVVSTDDSMADAATGSLPVYTPATAEAFATYGVVDDGAVLQPLLAPTGVIPQFGGLEITTSSTSLQALTDAVLYITRYRYDSSDAMASRIIAIAALRDVLEAFEAEGLPTAAEMNAAVTADVASLELLQQGDGGWGWWDRVHPSEPYHTVQVTHALLLADDRGFTVSQNTLDMALQYLADIESHIPSDYGVEERTTIRAYALWTLALAGRRDAAAAEALFAERGSAMQPDALAWIWGSVDDDAVHDEIGRLIANRVVETAGAANISTSYTDAAYVILHSNRRTDGIVLDALIGEDPESDLVPKLVNGLLAHRVQGAWDNIQENSFILLALHRYFVTYEAQTPDFLAQVWLGDQYAGGHQFEGRETDRVRFEVPMGDLIAAGDTDLVLAKDGTGRLYYRIGLRYAPDDLTLDPLDRGFEVTRTYEAVDDPGDVWRDDDGTWHIKAGARVRVTLQMVAESQRTHVALIDPLPAGLEALNPALAVTPSVPGVEGDGGGMPMPAYEMSWWRGWGPWYEHQQLRDDRAEAFTTFLPGGTYDYSYVARATTPGTFVVPPTRAEEMYAPETFGRSASDKVVVEP